MRYLWLTVVCGLLCAGGVVWGVDVAQAAPPPYDWHVVPYEDGVCEWICNSEDHYSVVDEHDGQSTIDCVRTTSTDWVVDNYALYPGDHDTWYETTADYFKEEYGIVWGKAIGPLDGADFILEVYEDGVWPDVINTVFTAGPPLEWRKATSSDMHKNWDYEQWDDRPIRIRGQVWGKCQRLVIDEVYFGLYGPR